MRQKKMTLADYQKTGQCLIRADKELSDALKYCKTPQQKDKVLIVHEKLTAARHHFLDEMLSRFKRPVGKAMTMFFE